MKPTITSQAIAKNTMQSTDKKGRFIKGVPAPHKGRKCPRMSLSKIGEKNGKICL